MGDLPEKIGKYQVRSMLGEGAMGVVYEGFDPDIERQVAIKILHPHLVTEKSGGEFLERFKREAKSAARCIHPNIVMVLEYGQDQDMPYIVMEFVGLIVAGNRQVRARHCAAKVAVDHLAIAQGAACGS